jgi:hypothetical protein
MIHSIFIRKLFYLCYAAALIFHVTPALSQNNSLSGEILEFTLHPVTEGFESDSNNNFQRARQEMVFEHEPDYEGSSVIRTALRAGDWYMGMAYDQSAGLLYIDRNHNLDLRDDGPPYKSEMSYYAYFSDVSLELMHGDIPVRYLLDINIISRSMTFSEVKSGWVGDIEIAGIACRMGIADNLDGQFDHNDLFFFDHARHRKARLDFGQRDCVGLPRWFYFEGQCYRLDVALDREKDETVLRVTLRPIGDDLMGLHFEGQHVSRIMLKGDRDSGMLDWPASVMNIPKGEYTVTRVDILDSFYADSPQRTYITDTEPALLKAGGPLEKTIGITRTGPALQMDYNLAGVGGMQYEPDRSEDNPGFIVYQGERQIARGNFEYG